MKNSKSIILRRQKEILRLLKETDLTTVDEIAHRLQISTTTVRRDFSFFQSQGIVKRYHGGAMYIGANQEDPSLLPETISTAEQKESLAKHAATFVEDHDTIFINSSTTALLMLKYITADQVTIVTNNGNMINTPRPNNNIEVIITGGEIHPRKKSLVGEIALSTVSHITADKMFMGVGAISAKQGITTSILQETAVNKMMMERCKGPIYVLTIGDKIGKEHNFLTGNVNDLHAIITTPDANKEELDQLEAAGLKISVIKTP